MDNIRVGIIGLGGRGECNLRNILNVDGVQVTALCDVYEDRCEENAKKVVEKGWPEPFKTLDYKEVLTRDDVDVVCVFSSWETHIEIAIEAMKAKKIVGMEVGGATSLQACWDLVDAYEETKMPIMFLENCCYGRDEMLVYNMVKGGVFGDVVSCHGAYAHDLRDEVAYGKENRHYRLHHYLTRNGENYPTHELGPIAKILNINRGNRMVRMVSMASKSMGIKRFIDDRKDTIENKDLIGVEFAQGDIVETLIYCENGETISLRLDTTLPRMYNRELTVHGTKALYEQGTHSVFLDGEPEEWEPTVYYKGALNNAEKFHDEYLPDIWRNITEEQKKAGHGGMDYFLFRTFFDCVRNNKPMPIDVYDAAAWMCITPLSEYSIANGNIPVEIPDFTRGKYKDRD